MVLSLSLTLPTLCVARRSKSTFLEARKIITPIVKGGKSFRHRHRFTPYYSTSTPTTNSTSASVSNSALSSPLYRIAKITKDGDVTYESKTISEILKGTTSMHARDLFSLNLTSSNSTPGDYAADADSTSTASSSFSKKKLVRATRPSAAILPREEDIIVSFGTVRALIGIDSGIIFDAHKPTIQLLADDISETFLQINCDKKELNQELDIVDSQDSSFELMFLEEILRDVSDTYARRLKIYEPIVDSISSRVTNEMFAATGIHRLVPVKDSIQEFEIQVQSALDSLKDLLMNDEDMVQLLLTQKKEAKEKGYDLDLSTHDDVELLIEEYARRLNTILHETNYLLKKVESKQDLIAISLDSYRNRMIRMNVYLSITGIGMGMSTAVAGFFGMNLISGLEESPIAFHYVVFTTTAMGILLGAGCVSYISGSSMRKRTLEGLNEITLIDGALSHMGSIDYAIKYMVNKSQGMSKENFRKRLEESQPRGQEIDRQEVDLLFDAFDASKDGVLFTDDLTSFKHISIDSRKRSYD